MAYYDTLATNNTVTPAAILTTVLNTAVLTYGPADAGTKQYEGVTVYPPPNSLGQEHPPLTYLRYLQRVLYLLETVTLSRSSQCAFDSDG